MLRAIILTQYRHVTDGRTDGIAVASTAFAISVIDHSKKMTENKYHQQQQTNRRLLILVQMSYGHYTRHPALVSISQLRTGGFCWKKILLPTCHVLAIPITLAIGFYDILYYHTLVLPYKLRQVHGS